MTTTSVPGSQLGDMVRRLRARPASSWRHGDREVAMRRALQCLADLASTASGDTRRAVPDVGVGALPDQLAVLADAARSAGAPPGQVDRMLDDLAGALGLR